MKRLMVSSVFRIDKSNREIKKNNKNEQLSLLEANWKPTTKYLIIKELDKIFLKYTTKDLDDEIELESLDCLYIMNYGGESFQENLS